MLETRLDALEKEFSHIKKMILECAYALDSRYSERKIWGEIELRHLQRQRQIKPQRVDEEMPYNQVQFIHRDKLANG